MRISLKSASIFLIECYKKIPLKHRCRFYPTCSSYAIESIEKFGFFRGFILAFARILRCNPFFEGGYDPVPSEFTILKNIKRR